MDRATADPEKPYRPWNFIQLVNVSLIRMELWLMAPRRKCFLRTLLIPARSSCIPGRNMTGAVYADGDEGHIDHQLHANTRFRFVLHQAVPVLRAKASTSDRRASLEDVAAKYFT